MIARNKPAVRAGTGTEPPPPGRNRRNVVRVLVSYRKFSHGRAFRPELGGAAKVTFDPDGLQARFSIPLGPGRYCRWADGLAGMGKDRPMNADVPAQPRILVVEDETIVAMTIEDALLDGGYSVVGPFAHLDDALQAAEREALDAALLDINIVGGMVFPVAEILARRGVPFLLATGYDNRILGKAHQDWPVVMKPYRLNDIVARLAVMTGRV